MILRKKTQIDPSKQKRNHHKKQNLPLQFQGRVAHPINLPYALQDLTSRHTHYKQKAVQLIYLGSLYLTTFERIADRSTMNSLCEI